MAFSLLLVLIITVGLSVTQLIVRPVCGPNEELVECVRCPPEDSCYDRGQILCPAVIDLPCQYGCVCKKGFIRKTLGRECIPTEECGGPCPEYEHYTECKECANSTCASIDKPVRCTGREKCTEGCTCWDGYYRDDEKSECRHRCSCPKLIDTKECAYWNTYFTS